MIASKFLYGYTTYYSLHEDIKKFIERVNQEKWDILSVDHAVCKDNDGDRIFSALIIYKM